MDGNPREAFVLDVEVIDMNTVYLEHPVRTPSDDWWGDQYESPETQVADMTASVASVAALLEADEHDLAGFIPGDKIIRVHGEKFSVYDALIVAALCLNDEERAVILNDCASEIRGYLYRKLDREVWA